MFPAALFLLLLYACTKRIMTVKNQLLITLLMPMFPAGKKLKAKRQQQTGWRSPMEIFSLSSNSLDPARPIRGEYIYKGADSRINIDSLGFIEQTGSLFNFYL